MKNLLIALCLAVLCGCTTVKPKKPKFQVGCMDSEITVLIDADGPGRLALRIDPSYCDLKNL